MIDTYRKLFDLLTRHERRRFFLLLGMVVVMGFVEMMGVASILPFLAVVADPSLVQRNQYMSALYDWLGLTDNHAFLILLGSGVFAMLIFGIVCQDRHDLRHDSLLADAHLQPEQPVARRLYAPALRLVFGQA